MKYELGLGCWALGGNSYGDVSESQAVDILETAYELGIRFFDTSPIYGDGLSEERLGKVLSKKQDVLIATKVGMLPHSGMQIPYNFTRNQILASVDESLLRLNRETIDLVQIHSPLLGFENEYPDIFSTMNTIIKSGKVKKFGISLRSPTFFKTQSLLYDWESYQYNLSILDQRINNSFEKSYVSMNPNKYFIARTPFNFGFLTEKPPIFGQLSGKHHLNGWSKEQFRTWQNRAQEVKQELRTSGHSILEASIRFPIDSGLANIVIPGAKTREELIENISTFASTKLNSNTVAKLSDFLAESEKEKVNSPYDYKKSD